MSKNKNKHYYLSILGAGLAIVLSLLVSTNSFASTYSLSLTSSGSQNIDVSGSGDMTAISSDSVNVSTTCRYGYNFTINTSVSDNNLYLNGNSANNTSDTYFTPTNGTATLKNNPNAWGYYYNDSAPTTAPTSSNIFSPVPALGNAATIKSPLASQSNTDINDSFNIYYGVASSSSIPIGNYKMVPDTNNSNNDGTIIYTATIADNCITYTVHFNPTGIFEGETLTGTGTMSDQIVYEDVSTSLKTNSFIAPNGYKFKEWNTSQDGTGIAYKNKEEVMNITTVGSDINLYAIWVPLYTVVYNGNGADANVGVMSNVTHTDVGYGDVFDLFASNYRRQGYGFAGWNTKADGTGANYGPNETIEVDNTFQAYRDTANRTITLYARWVASAGYLQNWTCPDDMNMPIGSVTALTDMRDNDTYVVAKLADSKCWIVENLRLDDSSELSAQNTNNPSLPLTNIYSTTSTSNYLSQPSALAYNENTNLFGWCSSDNATCYNQSRLNNTNETWNSGGSYSPTPSTISIGNNSYKKLNSYVYSYGNYYNWYSATAGNGVSNSSNGKNGDICPIGWHLPYGGSSTADKGGNTSGGFYYLDIQLGNDGTKISDREASNRWRKYPNNFVYSGLQSGGSTNERGQAGLYWSSMRNYGSRAYFLHINIPSIWPTNYDYEYKGLTVRCVSNDAQTGQ